MVFSLFHAFIYYLTLNLLFLFTISLSLFTSWYVIILLASITKRKNLKIDWPVIFLFHTVILSSTIHNTVNIIYSTIIIYNRIKQTYLSLDFETKAFITYSHVFQKAKDTEILNFFEMWGGGRQSWNKPLLFISIIGYLKVYYTFYNHLQ